MKPCPKCNTHTPAIKEEFSLKFGTETFNTVIHKCKHCEHTITDLKSELDFWGKKFNRNIIEIQPSVNRNTLACLNRLSIHHSIKKAPLIRSLTVFYLNHLIVHPSFNEIRARALAGEFKNFERGRKTKLCIPIRFSLYQKLYIESKTKKTTPSRILEEAIMFSLIYLESSKVHEEMIGKLEQFLADFAEAA